jgi:RNA polymerase sigma factor (sigma-70 family)
MDCAQEALTLCFQHWKTIRSPHAWCRLVASRMYIRRIAAIEDPVDDVDLAGPPLLQRADARLDEFENRHAILQMIEHLPLRQRQVLAWTYDGAPDAEIAEALQISPDAVRQTRRKARITLSCLANDGGCPR